MAKVQEWWMPLKGEYGGLEHLCDHVGDANEKMEQMWKELCRLRPELPIDGFDDNDDL
jgi:hypothetical protein